MQAALQAQRAQLAAPASAACQPLHLCFRFASPADCAGLATALEAIAGKVKGWTQGHWGRVAEVALHANALIGSAA